MLDIISEHFLEWSFLTFVELPLRRILLLILRPTVRILSTNKAAASLNEVEKSLASEIFFFFFENAESPWFLAGCGSGCGCVAERSMSSKETSASDPWKSFLSS
ncbi:hypothetical protein V6Z12_A13G139100 [Gossypium hirsutum]